MSNHPTWRSSHSVRTWSVILSILYAVGIVGTCLDSTRSYIIHLTPSFLLVNLGILLVFQPRLLELRFWVALIIIFSLGWSCEWLGVHTGFPFGSYSYGEVLGWKVDGVPLLIGINWVLLTLAAAEWMQSILQRNLVGAFSSALLLTALDGLIEPVAIKLGYWHWHGIKPPFQNYVSWFIISLLMVLIWYRVFTGRSTEAINPLAAQMLGLQFLFFIVLNWR